VILRTVVSDEGWAWVRTEGNLNTVRWTGELPVALGQALWAEVGKMSVREILQTEPEPINYQRVRAEMEWQARTFSSVLTESQHAELVRSYSSTNFQMADGTSRAAN
jgi:hypothetical protein